MWFRKHKVKNHKGKEEEEWVRVQYGDVFTEWLKSCVLKVE
jgi:hypothetical protein